MQRDNEFNSVWPRRGCTILVAALCLSPLAAALQSGGAFKVQVPIERGPEDVALHPFVPHPSGGSGGGVAVVRASQWDTSNGLLSQSGDEIIVIRTLNGDRAPLTNYGLGRQMTAVFGASDLVDVGLNISCSVLIGQQHDGSDPSTFLSFIDVVDLAGTYGLTGANCTLRWTSSPGFGYVHDVEIQEALCFAVVNHKNEARVVDLLHPTTLNVGMPLTADPAVVFADPTYQRNSVAVTRSTDPRASHRAVVTTCRRFLTNPSLHPVFKVTVLGLSATGVVEELSYSPDPAIAAHEPFDVAITPNDQLAMVVANDAVTLLDLTSVPAAHVGTDITTNGVTRDYAKLADALVLTDTYAVTLGAINGGADWQADVYQISSSALTKVHTLQGTGQAHDIDRSSDGEIVVIRTTEHVVVLKNPLTSPIQRTDVVSPSLGFQRDNNGLQSDSIVVSRKWAEQSSGGPMVVRHYAVALARDPDPIIDPNNPNVVLSMADTARVDAIDLTFGPHVEASWRLDDDNDDATVLPASLRMLPGGQMVSVCAVGAPYDQDPNTMPTNDLLAGTDAFVFDLRGQTGGGPIIGDVFQCERQGWPSVSSSPMEAIGVRSVSLSRSLIQGTHNGFIHTIEIIP